MMSHIRDGTLRAYLDGELAPGARERVHQHLKGCLHCRERLAALEEEARWVEKLLTSTAPDWLAAPRPQRVLTKIQTEEGGIRTMFGKLSKIQQRALVGVLVVVVVVGMLSLAPVRAWASEFLGIFRVERFVVFNTEPERLEQLGAVLSDSELLGDVEVLQDPGELQEVASLDEAAELVGFQPRTLSDPELGEPRVEVSGQGMVRITPDVEMVREVFVAMELDPALIPDNVDGQPFTITLPAEVSQTWESSEASSMSTDPVPLGDPDDPEAGGAMTVQTYQRTSPPLTVVQLRTPEVDVPNDVDVAALGRAMLQLFGMTPEEAQRLSESIDWTTTLVVPLPTDLGRVQEISVDGTTGLLFISTWDEETMSSEVALLWQKSGIVTMIAGSSEEQVLHWANELR